MHFVTKNKILLLVILGTLVWSTTMVKSGLVYSYGMGFWGPNGHDGIWHLAVISGLSRGSLDMPVFAGVMIHNYHIGFDLLVAILSRISFVPGNFWYFQILPPILAFLIGWLTYKLTSSFWSVFFVYFGGSLSWLVGKGESAFWSQQAISTLVNPPFALSLICLLLGLLFLEKKRYLATVVIFSLLPVIKIYAGIIGLSGLLFVSLIQKDKRLFFSFIASSVLAFLLFYPLNHQASGLLVWQPGWFLETMMGLSDRLNWQHYYQAMTTYRSGHVWFKLIPAYSLAFLIFLVGNLGLRVLGFFPLKKASSLNTFILPGLIIGTLFPMFFVQTGTAWNTIQFFYYVEFFMALLTGIVITRLRLNKLLLIIIAALTIPTTWDTFFNVYWPARAPAKLSREDLQALTFLSHSGPGVVLTYPATPDAYAPPPRPLFLYDSTGYVAAFSNHPTYLEDEVNLDITHYDWPGRRALVDQFFSTTDLATAKNFLTSQNISYIYLAQVAQHRPNFGESQLGFTKIYENSQVAIWQKL